MHTNRSRKRGQFSIRFDVYVIAMISYEKIDDRITYVFFSFVRSCFHLQLHLHLRAIENDSVTQSERCERVLAECT